MLQKIESFRKSALLPFLAFIFAFFIGGIIIALSDSEVLANFKSPGKFFTSFGAKIGNSYLAIFQGSIYDVNLARGESFFKGFYPLSDTVVNATPLILAGLAVALAFKSGLFNIGAQGQFIFGAIAASYVGFKFEFTPVLHISLSLLAAMIAAGIYGGIVGLLKAKTGAHEVIVTIMLNYIASFFILWILKTKVFLRPGSINPIAPEVNPSAKLPLFLGEDLRVHFGIFIALIAATLVWWLLNKSTLGFKFRAVGANSSAARTAGISTGFVTFATMFICGALAGLGGAVQVLGASHALSAEIGGSYGFDAITVALLGRATVIGTVLAAFLFGALQTSGLNLLSVTGTPFEIVQVIQALIVLFIATPALVKFIFRIKKDITDKSISAKGWNG
jgi:general nucleoside transport system permease protein